MEDTSKSSRNISTNISSTGSTSPEVIRAPITEEELRAKEFITPEDTLRLNCITSDFLCSLEDNVYDIEFVRFKIRDMDSDCVLFEINKAADGEDNGEENDADDEYGGNGADDNGEGDVPINPDEEEHKNFTPRFIRYYFKPSFLRLKNIGATMEFVVGDKAVEKFRMIERHYFRDRLLKSFDFEFGFCIPNSKNSCEHIYHIPHLSESLIEDMINNPFETRSDSFYFVNDRLVMHNKADYAYDSSFI